MKYKSSIYNIFFEISNGEFKWVLANTYSGGIIKASDFLKNAIFDISQESLDEIRREDEPLFNFLIEKEFIVEKSLDELKRLRVKFQMEKLNNSRLQYTLLPTTNCNLSCIYCYETPRKQNMNQEVMNRIKDFTKKRIPNFSSFGISWYGGEPLMAKEVIEELSKYFIGLCKEYNVSYDARLISNGTLLDKETVAMLTRSLVTSLQVSIDGLENIHNARRPYRRYEKSSFKDIIEGLINCRGKLRAEIRINVDRTNIDSYKELVDYLFDKGLIGADSGNTISLGVVKQWSDDVNVSSDRLLSLVEFNRYSEELKKYLVERGISNENTWALQPSCPCISVNTSYFVILPTGSLKKCWIHPTIDGTEVGTLDSGLDLSIPAAVEWTAYDPTLEPSCSKCPCLPICAGGCPYERMSKPEMKDKNCEYHKDCIMVNVLKSVGEEPKPLY